MLSQLVDLHQSKSIHTSAHSIRLVTQTVSRCSILLNQRCIPLRGAVNFCNGDAELSQLL